jgi:hypothetical protein
MAEPDFEKALRKRGPLTADELESGGVPKVYRQIGKLEKIGR